MVHCYFDKIFNELEISHYFNYIPGTYCEYLITNYV